MDLMTEVDGKCNLLETNNTNCLLKIMFFGTLPEYTKRGIGRELCKYSVDLASSLRQGKRVDLLLASRNCIGNISSKFWHWTLSR